MHLYFCMYILISSAFYSQMFDIKHHVNFSFNLNLFTISMLFYSTGPWTDHDHNLQTFSAVDSDNNLVHLLSISAFKLLVHSIFYSIYTYIRCPCFIQYTLGSMYEKVMETPPGFTVIKTSNQMQYPIHTTFSLNNFRNCLNKIWFNVGFR